MEIVNLVNITLQRLGTARENSSGFGSVFEISMETPSTDAETLRQLVISLAKEQGESDVVEQLEKIPNHGEVGTVFDVKSLRCQYSNAYAVCKVFPALKSNGRYFKLTEVR